VSLYPLIDVAVGRGYRACA